MFVCFHVLLGGLLWCGGVLCLVVSAVVYKCDLMCKLIKLHTRGCVGDPQILDISGNNTAHCYSITPHAAKIPLSRQLLTMGTR